ncbi:MAG: sigma-70 family RNA polymerase sigma factor [Deltaproteobacteria bacterium]|nr:sigma-70 family RNA polymerase sigma factor [Deltaproteobacteria bacterium]
MQAPEKTDRELITAAQAGDRAALDVLLTRHMGRVARFGSRMCSNPDTAQDVVQDTMLAVVRHLGDFKGDSQFSTWLYTIARRACLRKFRKSKFAPEREESLDAGTAHDTTLVDRATPPDERAEARELDRALRTAIAGLDPQSREVLVLRDVEGLSAAEVAEVTGANVGAVKSRLHRARVTVRSAMAPLLDGESARAQATPACRDVVNLFSQHLEGEIDGEVCRSMQAHMDACPRCRAQCDSLRQTLRLCAMQPAEVPPDEVTRVRRAIQGFLDSQAPAG